MTAGVNEDQNKHIVFLYSNQPVVKCNGKYYTEMKNFIDWRKMDSFNHLLTTFMLRWSAISDTCNKFKFIASKR